MPKQPKTYSLEAATVEAIERLAAKTRRNPGAIVDLAVELYDQVTNKSTQLPLAVDVPGEESPAAQMAHNGARPFIVEEKAA